MPVLFHFRYFDYYKAKPSGNHQLYKVGSNLSADLNHKQYKQASTRIFLTATIVGGGGGGAKKKTPPPSWGGGGGGGESQTDNSPPDLGQTEIITTNKCKY